MSNSPENIFSGRLSRGEFVFTSEIVPPVSGAAERLLEISAPLKGRVTALNVTDGPGGKVHMSSVAASAILAQNGFAPIMQLTCRDRNRIALQSDLLGASALGIKNVLLLTGDAPSSGDQQEAKPVFDVKSQDLLAWCERMSSQSQLPSGQPIVSPPKFFKGATDVPIDPPAGWLPHELLRKAEAGAEFIQTQLCYDIRVVKNYVAALADHGLTERLFILLGTGPLASASSARWMNDHLFGVHVPDIVIERLERAGKPKQEGRKLCQTFVEELHDMSGISGVHLMAPGNASSLPRLLDDLATS